MTMTMTPTVEQAWELRPGVTSSDLCVNLSSTTGDVGLLHTTSCYFARHSAELGCWVPIDHTLAMALWMAAQPTPEDARNRLGFCMHCICQRQGAS